MAETKPDTQLETLLNALPIVLGGLDVPIELGAQIEIPVAIVYKDGWRVAVSVKITITSEGEQDLGPFADAIRSALQATGLKAEGA